MSQTAEKPQLLLKHHLKQLKLPTFLAEYEKQAHECARDRPARNRIRLQAEKLIACKAVEQLDRVLLDAGCSSPASIMSVICCGWQNLSSSSANAAWSTGASGLQSSQL